MGNPRKPDDDTSWMSTAELEQKRIWEDDSVQFPRLLAEIHAAGILSVRDMESLCGSMDLTHWRIEELFSRAEAAFEKSKPKNENNGEER